MTTEADRIKRWLVQLADAAAFSNGRQLLAIQAEIVADLKARGVAVPNTSVEAHQMSERSPRAKAEAKCAS